MSSRRKRIELKPCLLSHRNIIDEKEHNIRNVQENFVIDGSIAESGEFINIGENQSTF